MPKTQHASKSPCQKNPPHHPREMKKGSIISIIIGLGLLGALMWRSESISEILGQSGSETTETSGSTMSHLEVAGEKKFKTKVGDRPPPSPAATHSPARLKDFILPTLVIDGLGIEEAMRKLKASYEDTCLKTGEVPINLRFDIPRGSSAKINNRLDGKNLNSAVKLLATLSGMTVSRKGTEYKFALFPDELASTTRMFNVPPDFAHTLDTLGNTRGEEDPFADNTAIVQQPISALLSKFGLELDSSTLIRPTSTGQLVVMSNSASDLAAISQLVDTLSEQKPMQLKFNSKVVELAPGVDFELPDTSQMTSDELQIIMRELSQLKGTDLMTLPSMIARNGESGTIEIGREYILPDDNAEGEFETHFVGNVMHLEGNALGFGQETAINFTSTTANDTAKDITIDTQIDVTDSGFTNDQGTRFVVQENPDGSKAIVLVTSTLIDATGLPINGGE
ncbi:MAG: hypothetical protein ACSHX9_10695 [Luteolibacter sp.]